MTQRSDGDDNLFGANAFGFHASKQARVAVGAAGASWSSSASLTGLGRTRGASERERGSRSAKFVSAPRAPP